MGRLRQIGLSLALCGIDAPRLARAARDAPAFLGELRRFRAMSRAAGLEPPKWRDVLPALGDRAEHAGEVGEYFLADLWTARRVYEARPERHVDVGSRIDGLVAHLATFLTVEVVDVRPARSTIEGIRFVQADATGLAGVAASPSVSSIHALEHFGLGRYGDMLDPAGHIKGLRTLQTLVAPGGSLYVGVPVGRPRVEFNAHRVLAPGFVPSILDDLRLVEFCAIVNGGLEQKLAPDAVEHERYAFGLYHFANNRGHRAGGAEH